MANLNNIYFNAAFCGALGGILAGRPNTSSTAADYATIINAAESVAQQIDSKIVFDAEVSTGAGITQLAITTNTIASDEQFKAGLLQEITRAVMLERYAISAVDADYDTYAVAIFTIWTAALAKLVTP